MELSSHYLCMKDIDIFSSFLVTGILITKNSTNSPAYGSQFLIKHFH